MRIFYLILKIILFDIEILIVNFNYLNKFDKDGEQAHGAFVRLPVVAVRVPGA